MFRSWMNDFNLNAKRQMFIILHKNVQFLFKTFLLFNFIRFWGSFFLKSCFQKEIKKIIVLSPKKPQENDHFEAFLENVNSNGYIKRAFKFVKWDRSYSLALIWCLKMKQKSPHNLRNRTACIQSRNSVTVFLFSYNHAACLQHA